MDVQAEGSDERDVYGCSWGFEARCKEEVYVGGAEGAGEGGGEGIRGGGAMAQLKAVSAIRWER